MSILHKYILLEIYRQNFHVINTYWNTRIDSLYDPSWWETEINNQLHCKLVKMCQKTTSRKPRDNDHDDDEKGERRREYLRRENEM